MDNTNLALVCLEWIYCFAKRLSTSVPREGGDDEQAFPKCPCQGWYLVTEVQLLSFRGQWGGCARAHEFHLHAQRAMDAPQNTHHLFRGDISYCKIREEVVQKSFLRQPEIISLSPRKNQVISPSMASFPIINK